MTENEALVKTRKLQELIDTLHRKEMALSFWDEAETLDVRIERDCGSALRSYPDAMQAMEISIGISSVAISLITQTTQRLQNDIKDLQEEIIKVTRS